MLNRDRPTFVIVHPDDHAAASRPARRGRPLREALARLADGPLPDVAFATDMESVLDSVGPMPSDQWAPS